MKLFLVTQQFKRYLLFKKNNVKNYLITYTDIWMKRGIDQERFREIITSRAPDERIFIDSGAHPISQGTVPVDFDQFHKAYLKFIKTYYEDIYCFAELDIEFKVGQEKVDEWYKEIEAFDHGRKCVRCFHPKHTFDRHEEYCQNEFVAIGGGWNRRHLIPDAQVMRLVKHAYDTDTKVHGFGCTSNKLKKFPFYSGDSNSWMATDMFGKYMEFKDGEVAVHESFRAQKKIAEAVTHPKAMSPKVHRMEEAIRAFLKYEDYLSRLWNMRGVKWPT